MTKSGPSTSKRCGIADHTGAETMQSISVSVTMRTLTIQKAISFVSTPSAGAIVTFVGTVRDRSGRRKLTHMVLESAEELAEKDLARICREAKTRFGALRVCVHHRVGRLRVGDLIVVIAVSAAHRREAFDACEYIIEELKKTTPIWKKEIGPGFQRWVKG